MLEDQSFVVIYRKDQIAFSFETKKFFEIFETFQKGFAIARVCVCKSWKDLNAGSFEI